MWHVFYFPALCASSLFLLCVWVGWPWARVFLWLVVQGPLKFVQLLSCSGAYEIRAIKK